MLITLSRFDVRALRCNYTCTIAVDPLERKGSAIAAGECRPAIMMHWDLPAQSRVHAHTSSK